MHLLSVQPRREQVNEAESTFTDTMIVYKCAKSHVDLVHDARNNTKIHNNSNNEIGF